MAIMLVATIKVRVGKDLGVIDRARKEIAETVRVLAEGAGADIEYEETLTNKRVKGEPS